MLISISSVLYTRGGKYLSVQSLSCVQLFVTPWTAACHASLSITNSQSLLKLMSIKSVMPSNHLILCHLLLLLPSIFRSIRIFSNESVIHIRWPKYWSFSFHIRPSNEYSGLISFRIDWSPCSSGDSQESYPTPRVGVGEDHHSSKGSVLLCSALFIQIAEKRKYIYTYIFIKWERYFSLYINNLSSLKIPRI